MVKIGLAIIVISAFAGSLFSIWNSSIWSLLLSVFVFVLSGIWPVTTILLIILLCAVANAPPSFRPVYLITGIPLGLGIAILLWSQYWHGQLGPGISNWQSDFVNYTLIASVVIAMITAWYLRKHLLFFGALLANFVWFTIGCGYVAWLNMSGLGF